MKSPLTLRLLLCLLTDVKRLEPDVKGLERDVITLKARFKHEGVGFLSVALPALCDSIDYGLAQGKFACPSNFSKSCRGALPKLFSGLLCKVFDTRTGLLRADACPGVVKCLREVLRLYKKLKLHGSRDNTLHADAVRTFWESERKCEESFFNPSYLALLSRVAGYCLSSLDSFEPSKIFPRHGPGAVYEKLASNQKWVLANQGILDESFDSSGFGFDLFGATQRNVDFAKLYGSFARLSNEHESGELREVPHGLSSGGLARLVTVPKNSVSRRTITVEPCLNMFIQQGLNTALRDSISRCSVLKQCLALTDQSENQILALKGSLTGNWATLDLSAASDLLSLRLVRQVFAQHQAFLRLMVECRSTHVMNEFTNSPQLVLKFAGMGNALTFPVQSVVFACIAISSILLAKGCSKPSYGQVKRTASIVRVYGDDIIVPSDYSHQVVNWIESLGLKVNQKKSFMVGNFRESCGLDAFRGYDVTPVYIKDDPDSPIEPSSLASLVASSNQCWLKGLYALSNELKEIVETSMNRRLPLLPFDSGGLGWITRGGACHFQKWDSNLHQPLVKAPVLVPIFKKDQIDGYPLLLKFFLTPLIQRGKGHSKKSVKRFSSRISWRWMPAHAGLNIVSRVDVLKR